MAGIPASAGRQGADRSARRWPRGIWWTGIAAAVAVTASVIAWLGMPWERHPQATFDANGGAARVYAADHNSLRPSDSNLYDINGIR